ncbi:MAG TPA: hypothetical protein V6C72_02025 [Chroococcales cyanobacterium]
MIRCIAALRLFAVLALILQLSACSWFGNRQREVPAVLAIEVKDPFFRRVTDITDSVEIAATGSFNSGDMNIRGVPVSVPPATTFMLDLQLPIDNPEKIEAARANGSITTSSPLTMGGAALPDKVVLKDGKAVGKIDLVLVVGVYLINLLQNQRVGESGAGEVSKLLDKVTISKAVLNLRPNASFDLGRLHINAAPGSKIVFDNTVIDPDGKYQGRVFFDINFAEGCQYQGKKVDLLFNAGHCKLAFDAQRENDLLQFKLAKQEEPVVLKSGTYKFGKNKRNTVTGSAYLKCREFAWRKRAMKDEWMAHVSSDLAIHNSELHLKTNKMDLIADFSKPVNSLLVVDLSDRAREYQWSTDKPYAADRLQMIFRRPNSSIEVIAANANVGPVGLDKLGDLAFVLDQGVTQLKEIDWNSEKKSVKLKCSADSTVAVAPGKDINVLKDQEGLRYDLPLTVKIGTADLIGAKSDTSLSNLQGKMDVRVEDEVMLDSDIDFALENDRFLGDRSVAVKAHGIKMSSVKGHSDVRLKDCSIVIPQEAIQAGIAKQVPAEKSYDIEKVVLSGQKWRYRDAVIDHVELRNCSMGKVKVTGPHSGEFKPSADVEVDGTIEKSSLLSVIKKTDNWQTKRWSAAGTVSGTGTVDFQFVPKGNLCDSELNYTVNIVLPPPDDVKVDWSQVSTSLLAKAEHGAITGMIKRMKPKTLTYKGTLKPFKRDAHNLSNWQISDLSTVGNGDDVLLKFQARLAM